MQNYILYNASAGAGKTFTLVVQFLKIILKTPKDYKVKNILAITFTNKAANEMKNRILVALIEIAKNQESKYLEILQKELNYKEKNIRQNANILLDFILHNYSLFYVSTIDKFNFRLLRAFSKELNIPAKFSIEMNVDYYLEQAINEISALIGTDDFNGKLLLDYVLYEFEENEKKVNFRSNLRSKIKDFLSEKNYFSTISLKDKKSEDFIILKDNIKNRLKENRLKIINICNEALNIIEKNNIDFSDFKGGKTNGIGIFFNKTNIFFSSNKYKSEKLPNYDNILKTLETGQYSATKTKNESIVNEIYLDLVTLFFELKEYYKILLMDLRIFPEIISVQVNAKINEILNKIKQTQDIVFIQDANPLINNNLTKETSYYIYEKIGSKFQHYFFDEFQDTSELQWNNFLPLVENTIFQENESVTLVGDVKQSIYRFKGGKPELFLNEINKVNNEYSSIGKVNNLPDNWRSYKNIVNFNNKLYYSYSDYFEKEEYKNIYKTSRQNPQGKDGGNVQVAYFKEDKYNEDKKNHILKIINDSINHGFDYSDIVILFRKNEKAKDVASFLIENNIPILSEDALFLSSIHCIDCILNLLKWKENKQDKTFLFNALYFINQEKTQNPEHSISEYFFELKKLSTIEIINNINQKYSLSIDFLNKENLSLYDLVEDLINSLNFTKEYQIYFSTLLQIIYSFETNKAKSLKEFLIYWENEGEKQKYKLAEQNNSVQIMTIHKSKGLEFPIVILPFEKQEKDRSEHNWYSINPDLYNGFTKFYIKIKKDDLKHLDSIQNEYINYKLEENIDDLNVNYVATTRAEKQMYLIFPIENESQKLEKSFGSIISDVFNLDLNQEKESFIFDLYKNDDNLKFSKQNIEKIKQEEFIWFSNSWKNKVHLIYKNDFISDSEYDALKHGNLVHDLLSKIKYKKDFETVFNKALLDGLIPLNIQDYLYDILYKVLNHKDLEIYFSENVQTFNEQEIMFEGEILRLDKIVKIKDEYHILDYKTGEFQQSYINQINLYENALLNINKKIGSKILIFINKNIEILYV